MSLEDGKGDMFPEEDIGLPPRETLLKRGGKKTAVQKPVKNDSNANNRIGCPYPHLIYRLDFMSNASHLQDVWQGSTKDGILENIANVAKKKDAVGTPVKDSKTVNKRFSCQEA